MQQLQQAQQQAEMEAQQAAAQAEQMRLDEESRQKDLDRQNRIEVALIQADTQRGVAELNFGALDDDRSLQLEREKLAQKDRIEQQKVEIESKRAENDRIKADAAMKSANRPPSSGGGR